MNSGENLMYFARKEQCLALGARTVLHKPVDPEALRQTVTEILGSPP